MEGVKGVKGSECIYSGEMMLKEIVGREGWGFVEGSEESDCGGGLLNTELADYELTDRSSIIDICMVLFGIHKYSG